MKPLVVLIPAKSARAKSRLSIILSPPQRQEFARLLLRDLISVIERVGLLRVSYVISPDRRVLRLASDFGANTIKEPTDDGVNSAVRRGIRETRGASRVLVLPSDLPLVRASELRRLVMLWASRLDVIISPSVSFDGTNALMFSSASKLPLSYDDNSFWNHLAAAARKGLSVGVCSEPGIMFDVDSPDDLRKLAQSKVKRPSADFARSVVR